MNPKYRALLWEECRVGGSLALVCLAIGVCGLCILYDGDSGEQWGWSDVGHYGARIVFGIPILLCLILTLQTSNSGKLTPEFSSRLLRLPLEIRPMVGLLLFVRLAMVVGATGILTGISATLLGQEFLLPWCFLTGLGYLYIQTVAWLHRPAPPLALLGYCLLGAAILAALRAIGSSGSIPIPAPWLNGLPLFLLLGAALLATYAINVKAVRATRCGARFGARLRIGLPTALPWPGFLCSRKFSTPFSAQFWWEFRTEGFYLPLYTLIMFVLFTAAWILAALFLKNKDTGSSPFTLASLLILCPPFAMMLAATVRAVARTRIPFSHQPTVPFLCTPQLLASAELAAAKLSAYAVSLALTLLVVMTASISALLFSHDVENWRLLSLEFSTGIITFREIIGYLFGVFVLYALFAWILGESRSTFLNCCVLWYLCTIPYLRMTSYYGENWRFDKPGIGTSIILLALWLPVVGIVVLMIVSLVRIRKKNLFPPRHVLYCLGAWTALTVFFFPFGHVLPHYWLLQLLLSMALSAGAVLPYPILTLAIQRLRYGSKGIMNVAEDLHRPRKRIPLHFRIPVSIGAVALILVLAWFRWPQTPGYKAFLNSQGAPVSTKDLEALYPAVPPEKNLALRYEEIGSQFQDKLEKYLPLLPKSPPQNRKRYVVLDWYDFSPDVSVSRSDWNITLGYYKAVVSGTAERLQEVARSGLTESRYPLSFPNELYLFAFPCDRNHHNQLLRLSGALNLQTLVLSVEEETDRIAETFLAWAPLANSLAKEPVLLSQTFRAKLLTDSVYALERVLNCMTLTPPDLARLRESFSESQILGDNAMKAGLAEECIHSIAQRQKSNSIADRARLGVGFFFFAQLRDYSPYEAIDNGRNALGWSYCRSQCDRGSVPRPGQASSLKIDAKTLAILPDFFPLAYTQYCYCQARLGQAVAACAVEEFRLAHGALPENLQALVPEFLAELPADPVNDGKPLSYKILANGSYTICSVGWDRIDYGPLAQKDSKPRPRELLFSVVPPAERHPPRILKEDPPS